MDSLVKVWALLWIGVLLWIAPAAGKLDKFGCLLCFSGSLLCLSVATGTSRGLMQYEKLLIKQQLLDEELTNSELAWRATQQEEALRRQYLIDLALPAAPPAAAIEPENKPTNREQLERSIELTDSLMNELIDRERAKKPKPLLSKGGQKLLEYGAEKGWIKLRTLKKNWGTSYEFNAKEVESFCDELVKAELAEWGDDRSQWRVIVTGAG